MGMNWWWLSFCDASRPEGQQFLGACLVAGIDLREAVTHAWEEGCNPGGEVQAYEVEEARVVASKFPRYKLLSRSEIEDLEAQH